MCPGGHLKVCPGGLETLKNACPGGVHTCILSRGGGGGGGGGGCLQLLPSIG